MSRKAENAPQLKQTHINLLKPGMKVSAKWMAHKGQNEYFEATVTSTKEGFVSVIYDDDGTSEEVLCRHIRILDEELASIIREDKETPPSIIESKKSVVLKSEVPAPNFLQPSLTLKTTLTNNNSSLEPRESNLSTKNKSASPNKLNQVVSKVPSIQNSLINSPMKTSKSSSNNVSVKSENLKRKHDELNGNAQDVLSASSPPSKKTNYESQNTNALSTANTSAIKSSKSLYEIKKTERVPQGSFENGDEIQEILGAGKHSETKELFFIIKWKGKPTSKDRIFDHQFKSDNPVHMHALRQFYRSHLVFGSKPQQNMRTKN